MASLISQLSQLIAKSVGDLEKTCKENGLDLPDMNAPGFVPQSEAFRFNPSAAEAAKVIAAASFQLATALLPPHEIVAHYMSGVRPFSLHKAYLVCSLTLVG